MLQVIFSAGTFEECSHGRRTGAVSQIADLRADDLQAHTEQRVREIVEKHWLTEVVLGDYNVDTSEVTVRANRFESLGFVAPGQNVVRKGTRITVTIPFSGSADLLLFQPREFDMARPVPGLVGLGEGTIRIPRLSLVPAANRRSEQIENLSP